MSSFLIVFKGDNLKKVESFNGMSRSDKKGDYWNNPDDASLVELKRSIKDHYLTIQKHTCPYCKQSIEVGHHAVWDIEHIVPKDQYPEFMFSPLNLCVSCKDCNTEKSNKNVLKNKRRKTLPTKSEDYLIIHPNIDEYDRHITILKSSMFYIPLDSKGKSTIEICGLLRFLYKFSDYGNVSVDLKKKINALNTALMDAKSGVEESVILAYISELADRGRKTQQEEHLDEILKY